MFFNSIILIIFLILIMFNFCERVINSHAFVYFKIAFPSLQHWKWKRGEKQNNEKFKVVPNETKKLAKNMGPWKWRLKMKNKRRRQREREKNRRDVENTSLSHPCCNRVLLAYVCSFFALLHIKSEKYSLQRTDKNVEIGLLWCFCFSLRKIHTQTHEFCRIS